MLRTPPGSLTYPVLHHVPVPAQTALDLSVPFRSCSAMMSLRCHHCSATFHRCSICFLFRALLPTVAPQRHHRFALVWFSDSVYKSDQLAHVTPDLFWLNHQLNLLHLFIYHNSQLTRVTREPCPLSIAWRSVQSQGLELSLTYAPHWLARS